MNHAALRASPDDALRGASLAFRRRSPAATSPLGGGSNRSTSPRGMGASTSDAPRSHDGESPGYRASSSALRADESAKRDRVKNPSFIAATLAATRSGSPGGVARRESSSGDAVDSESIAPAERLISLFERGRGAGSSPPERRGREKGTAMVPVGLKPRPRPPRSATSSLPPFPVSAGAAAERSDVVPSAGTLGRSAEKISAMPMPKPRMPPQLSLPFPHPSHHPLRPRVPSPAPAAAADAEPKQHGTWPSPSRQEKPASGQPRILPSTSPAGASMPEVILSPRPVRVVRPALAPPVLSSRPQNDGQSRSSQSPSPDPEKRDPRTHSRAHTPPKSRGRQRLIASQPVSRTRHRHPEHSEQSKPTVSSRTEFGLPIVSPAAAAPPRAAHPRKSPSPLPDKRDSVASAPPSPVLAPQLSRRHAATTPTNNNNLALDPLTNAMMASSLASARLTPHNTGSSLPPPPRRQKSPRLLQTLRLPQSHQDDDPERLKIAHRHKLSSNRHAHHEAARNRWRDQVTQRERKRYEAVWASNRGYLLLDEAPPTDGVPNDVKSQCVLNVVVREIWKRSRLPHDELMEVWELVDHQHIGMLTRQEFVVGMWLIDQRLRGRKIPARVSDSVWDSVNGVRLLQPRRKAKIG